MSVADEVGIAICPACGEPCMPTDRYCENCSHDLQAPAAAQPGSADPGDVLRDDGEATIKLSAQRWATACATCGGRIAADGYCETCGAPAVRERDHWTEHPVPWVAAVSDRGLKHARNEDAMAVSAAPRTAAGTELAALVVCDGVSSSTDSDLASLAAARAARDVLMRPAVASPSIAGRIRGWTGQLTAAAAAAGDAVLHVTAAQASSGGRAGAFTRRGGAMSPPSCTFVAAVVDGPVIIAGWIGDSRAYWLPDDAPAEQLSVDDSWATEQINLGLPRDQAERSPQAHAITRWLGEDAPGFEPRCAATIPNGPGWLLVCSDGLWNYCSPAADMARLVRAVAGGTSGDPLQTATELVAWANQQGGHDNITVALARLTRPAETTDPGTDVQDHEGE